MLNVNFPFENYFFCEENLFVLYLASMSYGVR
uniref:Uncharacterized protein n=1 Tax=Rhizophora mucronata TaxID=61149 RepID=A0A2P2MX78_RHIMU